MGLYRVAGIFCRAKFSRRPCGCIAIIIQCSPTTLYTILHTYIHTSASASYIHTSAELVVKAVVEEVQLRYCRLFVHGSHKDPEGTVGVT